MVSIPCLKSLRLVSFCGKYRYLNKESAIITFMKPHVKVARFCSESSDSSEHLIDEQDPAPHFFRPDVQELLKRLTGLDFNKVFATEPRHQFKPPRYEFMTEEQLQKALDDARQRAEERLQMPPVVKAREPIDETLSSDTELKGYDSSKFVFTDISYGISDRNRVIVIRDPDGTLRKVTWDERDRVTEVFFPKAKRKLGMPKMFLDENLMEVLSNEKYEFALDRACLQFEPDNPIFIKVCHKVYDHIDQNSQYDVLLSTRHYGPMVFYFAFFKSIDNLVLHLIKNDRLGKAGDVVRLYQAVNPKSKSANIPTQGSELLLIKAYTEFDSRKRANLELAIQSYEELQKQQQSYFQGVKEAHGQT